MLLTSCPECGTKYHVTSEDLTKAGGQVRCGRCASVFDAFLHAEARNGAGDDPEVEAKSGAEAETETGPDTEAATKSAQTDKGNREIATLVPTEPAANHQADGPAKDSNEKADGQNSATSPSGITVPSEDTIEPHPLGLVRPAANNKKKGERDGNAAHGAAIRSHTKDTPASDARIAEPGSTAVRKPKRKHPPGSGEASREKGASQGPHWPKANARTTRSRGHAVWKYAVCIAALFLVVQLVNHFRSELARSPTLRPVLNKAYSLVGIDLIPQWDIDQYTILASNASTHADASGGNDLRITARIRNDGPAAQPLPKLRLQLKNRWEKPIASRTFTPMEYLPQTNDNRALMPAGSVTHVQLDILDPDAKAYGFELDVCIEQPDHTLSCANDKAFR